MNAWELIVGDCVEAMRAMEPESVDAIVTDPPYGLEFMGKEWDRLGDGFRRRDNPADVGGANPFGRTSRTSPEYRAGTEAQAWHEAWACEALRVLKPGGYLLAFGGTRTVHRLVCAIEDAGFEIRDMIAWVYGSGFPKSLDVSKAIDKAAGAEREVVGKRDTAKGNGGTGNNFLGDAPRIIDITAPATDAAKQWAGWGTALKPAHEPAILARKPLVGTVAENVLRYGTGALNIDACRYPYGDPSWPGPREKPAMTAASWAPNRILGKLDYNDGETWDASERGRWPANLYHCPKPDRGERDDGLDDDRNLHPTVKPLALMRWLCRLVTPPGGLILDPFAGSGTTIVAALRENFRVIGIEKDEGYAEIARARIAGRDGPLFRAAAS